MRTAIVFNHPYEGSYCNAVLEAVQTGLRLGGHETDLFHLDNDGFDPVMRQADLKGFKDGTPVDPKVLEYRSRLEQADHLVLIFPIWWELMPAMTKGFIDKVIFPGVAYDYDNSGRWPKMIAHHYHEHPLFHLQADLWQCDKESRLHGHLLEDGIWTQKMDQPEYGKVCFREEEEEMAGCHRKTIFLLFSAITNKRYK